MPRRGHAFCRQTPDRTNRIRPRPDGNDGCAGAPLGSPVTQVRRTPLASDHTVDSPFGGSAAAVMVPYATAIPSCQDCRQVFSAPHTQQLSYHIRQAPCSARGLVLHTDHGVQFTSSAFSQKTHDARIAPSFGAISSRTAMRWRSVLRRDAGRASRPPPLGHAPRVGDGDQWLLRPVPQHPPTPQRPRHAYPHRTRTPSP